MFVLIAATLFGWWVWRGRRRARAQGYASVPLANGFLGKRRDVEAGDFDENELDNLRTNRARANMETEPYDLASDSDDEDTGSKEATGTKQAGAR